MPGRPPGGGPGIGLDDPMRIARDADVLALPAADAVEVMRGAVADHAAGRLIAPPRSTVALGEAALTLTAGRAPGVAAGFRMYSAGAEDPTELTLVLDAQAGPGIVLGRELGRRRTGALGGVAADLAARPDATVIGLVGAGRQAFAQLWAIAAVRALTRVRVSTRSARTAQRFAERARAELGLAVETVDSPRAAVDGADIVVLATPSTRPLIDADWIADGAHVHTLGPKGAEPGECPIELVQRAAVLMSDSPDQLAAMQGPGAPWTGGAPVASLGAIARGDAAGRSGAGDVTVYASVGLAGTEVLLARLVLARSGAPA